MADGDSLGAYTLPDIPDGIREAAKKRKLVLFVGSGMTQLFGLPSWRDLAKWAREQLMARELLSFSASQQLATLDPRKQLSIALDIAKRSGFELSLVEKLRREPLDGGRQEFLDAVIALSGVCVTTNYDTYLEVGRTSPLLSTADIQGPTSELLPPATGGTKPATGGTKTIDDARTWIAELENGRAVIHLHGSVRDQGSMIVSTRHYLKHYQSKHVREFLRHLFTKRTVLFLGYGLDEVEVIEHLVHSAVGDTEAEPAFASHYWLYPMLARDRELLGYLSNYYRDHLGVHLVGYSIDRRGYSELMGVIKAWASRMQARPRDVIDHIEFVNEVLSDVTLK